jgi:hypothetical protein
MPIGGFIRSKTARNRGFAGFFVAVIRGPSLSARFGVFCAAGLLIVRE